MYISVRTIEVIGAVKAISLVYSTEDIMQSGGMMIAVLHHTYIESYVLHNSYFLFTL